MKGVCTCLAMMCLAVSAMGSGVTRSYEDLNGDGVPEIILENEYLRVGMTSGEGVEEPPERIHPDGYPIVYHFGKRFNWAGWIWEYTFKPTNRQWFVHVDTKTENWHGIPECFEQAVRMKETAPGRYDVLVPGIGLATATGACFRWSFKDVVHFPWEVKEECEIDGVWKDVPEGVSCADGWRITFTQRIDTAYDYGCVYKKVVTLRTGSSKLVTDRYLENTGKERIQTTWFTHGFFGQGEGGVYDNDCWTTIPLIPPNVKGSSFPRDLVDTEIAHLRKGFKPAYYWGPLSAEELGGNWHAAGNSWNGDILMNAIDKKLAFFRHWTDALTYSCEPFLALDVEPGTTYEWRDIRGAGNGLRGIKAQGSGGMVDWTLSRGGDKAQVTFLALPYQKFEGKVQVKGRFTGEGGLSADVNVTSASKVYGPEAAVALSCNIPAAFLGKIAGVELTVSFVPKNGKELEGIAVKGSYWMREGRRTEIKGDARKAVAVVFSDIKINHEQGEWALNQPSKIWERILEEAGFDVRFAAWNSSESYVDWSEISLAVVAYGKLSPHNLRRMESFVKGGGSVIFQGPVNFREYNDISDILPISMVNGEINVRQSGPRDGTREFTAANANRYHIVADKAHPVLEGLPLYPESNQGIGQFQLVTLKPGAEVIMWFTGGRDVPEKGRHPGLIVSKYGEGQVALMTSSVQWGAPPHAILWGRLGEYHKKLFAQLSIWMKGESAERPLSCVPTKKLENDCYNWELRHIEKCHEAQSGSYDIVMIGDSITHFWETKYGPKSWKKLFKGRKVMNLGFGWDRTCNVLWRLKNGELGGQKPKVAVVHIGTNNLTRTPNYPGDTPEQVLSGIDAVVKTLRQKSPRTRIVVMKVFPRGLNHELHREKINALNVLLEGWALENSDVTVLDITEGLMSDGELDTSKFVDNCHLNESGYKVWSKALEPIFEELGL